jgi:hypothetical protein
VEYAVTGTNNIHVTGTMVVSNAANGETRAFAASNSWRAAPIPLQIGRNEIFVIGTNALGVTSSDSTRIDRQPPTPTACSATDGTLIDVVRVSWHTVAGATKYGVYRNTTADQSTAELVSGMLSGGPYEDSSVTPGLHYVYWIRSWHDEVWSDFSTADQGHAALSVATGVVATIGIYTDRVSVTWAPVHGATHYTVYRNETPDMGSAIDISGLISTTGYDDVSAIPGQLYTYWVVAGAPVGWFGWSGDATGYALLVANPDDRLHWRYRDRSKDVLIAKRMTLPIASYLAEGWTLGISDGADGTVTEGPHVMSTRNGKKWKYKGARTKIIYVEKYKKNIGVIKGKLHYKTRHDMPRVKGIYFGPPK